MDPGCEPPDPLSSFVIPLLGISIWAALQRNYPMFLLIGMGIPASFWPMAVAGGVLDREDDTPIPEARRPLRTALWVAVAGLLAFNFLVPWSIWPATWQYSPVMLPLAFLPMNVIFLIWLCAKAPGPRPANVELLKELLLFAALIGIGLGARLYA